MGRYELEFVNDSTLFKGVDGILIPGGFGDRGEGKIYHQNMHVNIISSF